MEPYLALSLLNSPQEQQGRFGSSLFRRSAGQRVDQIVMQTSSQLRYRARHRRAGHRRPLVMTFRIAMIALLSSGLVNERRWWAIHRTARERSGFWEKEVRLWHQKVAEFADPREVLDYLDKKYVGTFRIDYATWTFILRRCEGQLEHERTGYREISIALAS